MSSDNDLIRRGDALVKARPFCESQGDEWDRGYNTAISHYQVALLALTAAPAAEDALLRRPPLAVMLAVEVLCNHVEPGWENSKTIVRAWIDEERATRAALAGEK